MSRERSVEKTLAAAQRGDPAARDDLIKSHREFITRVSARTCKKFLTWGNDDELSVAQLAFNEAIDKFRPGLGMSFYSFAGRVIRSRLVDYVRRESKHRRLALVPMTPEDEVLGRHDILKSVEQYQENQRRAFLSGTVEEYVSVLEQYSITLDELIRISPKHKDSREKLQQVALCLTQNPEMMDYLRKYKLLPIKKLESLTGVKRRVLEKGRKYIIALAIILTDDRFYPLKEFTQIQNGVYGKEVPGDG